MATKKGIPKKDGSGRGVGKNRGRGECKTPAGTKKGQKLSNGGGRNRRK